MNLWTPGEVSQLLRQIGLGESVARRALELHIDGNVFATLSARSSKPLLRQLFCEERGSSREDLSGLAAAGRRLLVLLVLLILRFRSKFLIPRASVEEVREQYAALEIKGKRLHFHEIIGQGGFGHVYRAEWMHANVAAKVFHTADTGARTLPRDFLVEVDMLCNLRHPNITTLIGFSFKPRVILVTDYIEGGSLYDFLHGGPEPPNWDVRAISTVSREICLGIMYLHERDIVHCDLKSSNILLNGLREVKICDFGLAHRLGKVASRGEEQGVIVGCVGTHNWMAPEVLRGEAYSKAADAYSFGMIVWETVSRRVPFQGYSAIQVIGLVGYGRRRPQLPPGCPEPLSRMLAQLLRPRSRERQCFAELANTFRKIQRAAQPLQ